MVIDSLGHSAAAYKAAKDRFERKFGGQRSANTIIPRGVETVPTDQTR